MMLIVVFLALATSPAQAHLWYEPACCGINDCRAVKDGVVKNTKDGVHVEGWGILSYTDPRLRWSRDDHDHICASTTKLHCVYRQPQWY